MVNNESTVHEVARKRLYLPVNAVDMLGEFFRAFLVFLTVCRVNPAKCGTNVFCYYFSVLCRKPYVRVDSVPVAVSEGFYAIGQVE